MARITKKEVQDFLKMEQERYGDISDYTANTLAWSFLLGMVPRECEGMYCEEDMDEETIQLYDDTVSIVYTLRHEGKI